MLNRKISTYLDNWKQKSKKKSLVVEGPRQVGKTYIIDDFIKRNYDEKYVFIIDFKVYPSIGHVFNRGFFTDRIYKEVNIRFPNKVLEEGKSILFFDNIQLFPKVIETLRYFTEDLKYDVVCAGTNLGVIYKKMSKFPVGYIDRVHLNSLDFAEFVWANGYSEAQLQDMIDLSSKKEIEYSVYNDVFVDLFKEYMAIGGMPSVVSSYIKTGNFKRAFDLQQEILELYRTDVDVYAKKTMQEKILACFNSIPDHLMKDNKKFQFKMVNSKARASTYQSSVDFLIDSEIVFTSHNLVKPVAPLSANLKESTYKLYMHDPGLLVCMLGEKTQLEILKGNVLTDNGSVIENTVARMLFDSGKPLYYYESNSTLNVDFVININRKVTPIIVREANNPKSKVLSSLAEKFELTSGIKLLASNNEFQIDENNYPLYLAMYLDEMRHK